MKTAGALFAIGISLAILVSLVQHRLQRDKNTDLFTGGWSS